MCSDNIIQAYSSRREMVVDFEGAKQILERNNVAELKLPKAHDR